MFFTLFNLTVISNYHCIFDGILLSLEVFVLNYVHADYNINVFPLHIDCSNLKFKLLDYYYYKLLDTLNCYQTEWVVFPLVTCLFTAGGTANFRLGLTLLSFLILGYQSLNNCDSLFWTQQESSHILPKYFTNQENYILIQHRIFLGGFHLQWNAAWAQHIFLKLIYNAMYYRTGFSVPNSSSLHILLTLLYFAFPSTFIVIKTVWPIKKRNVIKWKTWILANLWMDDNWYK